MTIPYKKRKEYYQNYYRSKTKNQGVKSVKINTNDLTPNQGVKIEGVKKGVNLTPKIEELKEEINRFKKELEIVKNQLENLQQLLTKRPTEISVKKEPRKVVIKEPKPTLSPTKSPTNKVTIRFDKNLLSEIQSFLTKNPHSFPSFSHFIRDSLVAYKNGLKINDQQKFITSEKKSLRMDQDLQNICLGLPAGKKYQILNQILSAFLSTQN